MALFINSSSLNTCKTTPTVHHLPCTIERNGKAKTESFFETGIRQNTAGKGNTASFRGRPLHGDSIQIPSGYTGIILKEPRKQFNEDEDRELVATHKFTDFTYWNLDCVPNANDKVLRSLDWIELSKSIHAPLNEDNSPSSTPEK